MRRFECVEGSARKFWEVEVQGPVLRTTWGKIGAKGQTKETSFASEALASAAAEKLVREKCSGGYAEIAPAAGTPEDRPRATGLRVGAVTWTSDLLDHCQARRDLPVPLHDDDLSEDDRIVEAQRLAWTEASAIAPGPEITPPGTSAGAEGLRAAGLAARTSGTLVTVVRDWISRHGIAFALDALACAGALRLGRHGIPLRVLVRRLPREPVRDGPVAPDGTQRADGVLASGFACRTDLRPDRRSTPHPRATKIAVATRRKR